MDFLRFIIIVGVLIVVHEFGHFIIARKLGVKVDRFSIGFGPILFKRRIKDFDFLICCIPLGGYVKLAGDSPQEHTGGADEYLSQPVRSRAFIVGAGPVFNYILAWVIFCLVFALSYTPRVGTVLEGHPAMEAGIMEGDIITEVDSRKVDTWREMSGLIQSFQGEQLKIGVERAGKTIFLNIKPDREEAEDISGKKLQISFIGIGRSSERYPLYKAPYKALSYLGRLTFLIIKGLSQIIAGIVPLKESVTGVFGIYVITSNVSRMGIAPLLHLVGLLSVSLCVFNLLPMPVLDGGHLFFLLLEKFRKKPLSSKAEELITQIGLAIIILLCVFVFYIDFLKFGPQIFGG